MPRFSPGLLKLWVVTHKKMHTYIHTYKQTHIQAHTHKSHTV